MLRATATASRSARECRDKSVPLGKYCRSKPLVFSLVPRCQLFKTEVIRRLGPWRNLDAVEFATLTWVDWFNTRRLLQPIGYVPPAEFEARYYEQAAVA